ncbi:MAG: hypothetical protein AAF513_02350 [Pseudomonadota bacterium]
MTASGRAALTRSLFAGIAGLLVYGGWAVFVNWTHGADLAWRAGLVQGTYSLILTFIMTLVTEGLFARLTNLRFRIPVTTGIIAAILFASAYGIHVVARTPEIIMTILPGFVIGTIYTLVYVMGLARAQRGELAGSNDGLNNLEK